MPNQRREGQTVITFQTDSDFANLVEKARGFTGRSQFIREAIAEKLKQMGFEVSDELINPPPRTGLIIASKQSGSHNLQINMAGKKNIFGAGESVPSRKRKK